MESQQQDERLLEFERIASEVEEWGESMLFGDGAKDEGWKPIAGWKRFNPRNDTTCYMKFLDDTRGRYAIPAKDKDDFYPCVRIYSTFDAPIKDVCAYLSTENFYKEYNALVVEHRVLEQLTPHSKICWGRSPQILFITPRDFVTFCSHRWKSDGSQIFVYQACEHDDAPGSTEESQGDYIRAQALRGAQFISPHPEDPNKTLFSLISHAQPGNKVARWLAEQGANMLAPIEAFKLCHNIDVGVKQHAPYPEIQPKTKDSPPRSNKPGGMAMFGFCAFFPDGGGLEDPADASAGPPNVDPTKAQEEEKSETEKPPGGNKAGSVSIFGFGSFSSKGGVLTPADPPSPGSDKGVEANGKSDNNQTAKPSAADFDRGVTITVGS